MRRAFLAALLSSSVVVLGLAQAGPTPASTTSVTAPHQARIDAAKKALTLLETEVAAGIGSRDDVYTWSRHLYEAERDAGVKTAGDYYVAEAELWK